MGYPGFQNKEIEARAIAAEDELSAIRGAIRFYQRWLADPTHGGLVIYRREVIERLSQILDE